ncbi:RpiB/LacA/LacB family sugar-phosphate isomerase [Blattabacterium cuenoti]|uniref:RpiB/LacA/LacB family sugar-phosphate isomerase n=1 Tax=Blattabacterium cuenoti TaxID=1653831 RepID=UPI00163C55F3|nr:RpiB/LacA/LacB family sugar-phosphate isomerase [Blattabacterium cuenoti]
MIIAIGADHTGINYKNIIKTYLQNIKNYQVKDCGYCANISTNGLIKVDYPDFVHPTAKMVVDGKADFGIIICGSGNGAAMTANKYPQIRAALVWKKEIALLARKHNNANIISLPSRFISQKEVLNLINIFFNTEFEGGRHKQRIKKIPIINKLMN